MLNLDTHIVINAMTGQLRPAEVRLLSADHWGISDIVLWEIGKLAQLGRVEIDLDDADVARFLDALQVWPITLDICRTMRSLDFRSDPADEIIAATSIVHRSPLLTRDRVIRKSKLVPLAG
jgi:PIN domain nuclease of toxin-antitoxin system